MGKPTRQGARTRGEASAEGRHPAQKAARRRQQSRAALTAAEGSLEDEQWQRTARRTAGAPGSAPPQAQTSRPEHLCDITSDITAGSAGRTGGGASSGGAAGRPLGRRRPFTRLAGGEACDAPSWAAEGAGGSHAPTPPSNIRPAWCRVEGSARCSRELAPRGGRAARASQPAASRLRKRRGGDVGPCRWMYRWGRRAGSKEWPPRCRFGGAAGRPQRLELSLGRAKGHRRRRRARTATQPVCPGGRLAMGPSAAALVASWAGRGGGGRCQQKQELTPRPRRSRGRERHSKRHSRNTAPSHWRRAMARSAARPWLPPVRLAAASAAASSRESRRQLALPRLLQPRP